MGLLQRQRSWPLHGPYGPHWPRWPVWLAAASGCSGRIRCIQGSAGAHARPPPSVRVVHRSLVVPTTLYRSTPAAASSSLLCCTPARPPQPRRPRFHGPPTQWALRGRCMRLTRRDRPPPPHRPGAPPAPPAPAVAAPPAAETAWARRPRRGREVRASLGFEVGEQGRRGFQLSYTRQWSP